MLPEVRRARVLDAIRRHHAKRLSCVEAGELLSMSERHFRRLRDAYEERRSCSWTKNVLQLRGLTAKAQKRGVHRRKRERRPLPGMMLFQTSGALRRLATRLAGARSRS
jgi:hypothetical protein